MPSCPRCGHVFAITARIRSAPVPRVTPSGRAIPLPKGWYTCHYCKGDTNDWNHVIECREATEELQRMSNAERAAELYELKRSLEQENE